jgi:flagellar motor protein MotB
MDANDKQYRRGLVLGLTVAEVMILLIFVLLMVLAAALQNRDERIEVLDRGGGSRLIEKLQSAYPQARNQDEYFKELVRAIEVRRQVEQDGADPTRKSLLEDAAIGRDVRQAAEKDGVADPREYARNLAANANRSRKGEWPPFVSLSEAGGYYFDIGKATLKPEFESNLIGKVIPMLARNLKEYDVDVIEVIGHTDEVPMVGQSNLDTQLVSAAAGTSPIAGLRSTDNAGLAMARAVSVVHVLRADTRLAGARILPMSGAQMIVPVDRMANGSAKGSDQSRRRIEIRLRRSTVEATSTMAAK